MNGTVKMESHTKTIDHSLLPGHPHNIYHAIKYNGRLVSICLYRFNGRYPAQHQNGIYTAFQSGDDIRVHTVPDNHGVCTVTIEQIQACAHH